MATPSVRLSVRSLVVGCEPVEPVTGFASGVADRENLDVVVQGEEHESEGKLTYEGASHRLRSSRTEDARETVR